MENNYEDYEELPMRYKIGEILIKISAILAGLYLAYLAYTLYTSYQDQSSNIFGIIGIQIALNFIMPHLLCTIVAFILNIIAISVDNNTLLLVSAILYTVAMVLLFTNFYCVIFSAVLMYIAFYFFSKK